MKARIWNDFYWIKETRPQTLRKRYERILKKSGFHILKFIDHKFHPPGYTALWLLSESHLAIHTWPKEKRTRIEISSCNYQYFKKFKKQEKR